MGSRWRRMEARIEAYSASAPCKRAPAAAIERTAWSMETSGAAAGGADAHRGPGDGQRCHPETPVDSGPQVGEGVRSGLHHLGESGTHVPGRVGRDEVRCGVGLLLGGEDRLVEALLDLGAGHGDVGNLLVGEAGCPGHQRSRLPASLVRFVDDPGREGGVPGVSRCPVGARFGRNPADRTDDDDRDGGDGQCLEDQPQRARSPAASPASGSRHPDDDSSGQGLRPCAGRWSPKGSAPIGAAIGAVRPWSARCDSSWPNRCSPENRRARTERSPGRLPCCATRPSAGSQPGSRETGASRRPRGSTGSRRK